MDGNVGHWMVIASERNELIRETKRGAVANLYTEGGETGVPPAAGAGGLTSGVGRWVLPRLSSSSASSSVAIAVTCGFYSCVRLSLFSES